MSTIFRQWRHRLQNSNKMNDDDSKNIYHLLDKLLNDNYLLNDRFNKLEEKFQQSINNEQINLLKRIERLENENRNFHNIYQTYFVQNEKCMRSTIDLIVKIFSTQQEIRKQCIDRYNEIHLKTNQQQDENLSQSTQNTSSRISSKKFDDSQHTSNNQTIWDHQRLMNVEEQDQKTTHYSSEFVNYPSKLATKTPISSKSSTSRTNKLYFILNNEKSTCDNRRLPITNIVPFDDSPNSSRKQKSSMTLNKNRIQTNYSNHERFPTTSMVKNSSTTQTKSIRTPTRPPITNIRQRSPVVSTSSSQATNKSSQPRYTLAKPTQPLLTTHSNKTNTSRTHSSKTRIPVPIQKSGRVTDLDRLMAEQNDKISSQPIVQNSLFSKTNVKLVRPVRSEELKLFSCHLTPEMTTSIPNQPISIFLPSSSETITNNQLIQQMNSSSDISSVIRDFSDDSLSENYHIQKLLQQNKSIDTRNGYVETSSNARITVTDPIIINEQKGIEINNENDKYYFSIDEENRSSFNKSKTNLFTHRLVFPARLGRIIFYRRTLSDSDIYQKIFSKDNEILHNVYHLDTIRDYSMEFYMLTTYASDSQLCAWIDSTDDEIVNSVCHFDDDDDDDSTQINDNQIKLTNSKDSLCQDEELVWYSELEVFNLSMDTQKEKHENTCSSSSEPHIEELLRDEQFSVSSPTDFSNSTDLTSSSLTTNKLRSTIIENDNLYSQEVPKSTWTDNLSPSNSEQYRNDSTSSIITDEFQSNFYYLSPITNTTSFSKN